MKKHDSKVVAQYAQIPVMIGDLSFLVINTNNQAKLKWYLYEQKDHLSEQISSEISEMGVFCSKEKIDQLIECTSRIVMDISYSLKYGYQYTDNNGETIKKSNTRGKESICIKRN